MSWWLERVSRFLLLFSWWRNPSLPFRSGDNLRRPWCLSACHQFRGRESFCSEFVERPGAAWLGTRRNSGYYGTWKQLDGEEVTFNMLRERESLIPVGRFDRDDSCVMIYGGQWYSVGCSDGGPAATMCKRRISWNSNLFWNIFFAFNALNSTV